MKKVELIARNTIGSLETEINDFIQGKEVVSIDVKELTVKGGFLATVIYEVKEAWPLFLLRIVIDSKGGSTYESK